MRLPALAGGAHWGVSVRDAATGEVLAERDAARTHPTASVGKLLLLVELARLRGAGLRSDGARVA